MNVTNVKIKAHAFFLTVAGGIVWAVSPTGQAIIVPLLKNHPILLALFLGGVTAYGVYSNPQKSA